MRVGQFGAGKLETEKKKSNTRRFIKIVEFHKKYIGENPLVTKEELDRFQEEFTAEPH